MSFARTGSSFLSGPFNFAKQETAGIDADLSYRKMFDNGFGLSLRGIVSYLIRRDNYTDITLPNFINQQKLELGDPEWRGSLNVNLEFKTFDINYRFRYEGKMVPGTFEAQNSLQDRPPENADQYPFVYYPPVTYSDIRLTTKFDDRSTFYVGVDNLFDQLPPYGLTGAGSDAIYDNVGRTFSAGIDVRF
ncbi:TonB-dependent receptor domain-containing protein [Sphingomonas sp. MMS24-JH45]